MFCKKQAHKEPMTVLPKNDTSTWVVFGSIWRPEDQENSYTTYIEGATHYEADVDIYEWN